MADVTVSAATASAVPTAPAGSIGPLVMPTLLLAVFVVHVPVLIALTVAPYATCKPAAL